MIEHWLLLRLTSWRLGLAGLTAAAIATTYLTTKPKGGTT